uniref:Uncharacterized protein n=1 Tax=Arundo donax TaxID=35708 RepID=A0A0A9A3M2_ARUDO
MHHEEIALGMCSVDCSLVCAGIGDAPAQHDRRRRNQAVAGCDGNCATD